jgi:hypothetical protein
MSRERLPRMERLPRKKELLRGYPPKIKWRSKTKIKRREKTLR